MNIVISTVYNTSRQERSMPRPTINRNWFVRKVALRWSISRARLPFHVPLPKLDIICSRLGDRIRLTFNSCIAQDSAASSPPDSRPQRGLIMLQKSKEIRPALGNVRYEASWWNSLIFNSRWPLVSLRLDPLALRFTGHLSEEPESSGGRPCSRFPQCHEWLCSDSLCRSSEGGH